MLNVKTLTIGKCEPGGLYELSPALLLGFRLNYGMMDWRPGTRIVVTSPRPVAAVSCRRVRTITGRHQQLTWPRGGLKIIILRPWFDLTGLWPPAIFEGSLGQHWEFMFLFWTICNGQPYLKYCLFYNEEVDLYIFLSIDVKHHFRMPPTSLEEEHSTFHLRLQSVSKFLLVLNFPMNWLKCSCHCCVSSSIILTLLSKKCCRPKKKNFRL